MQDATNRWDFLTGLELVCRVKLSARDREFFGHVQEAWTQMVRSVVEAFRGGVSTWAMLSWERTLGRKLREMGRLFVEHVVNRIEPEDERELPQHERFDGEWSRRKNQSPLRNLNCAFGRIELKRCLYQPLESSGRCLFPLERRLQLDRTFQTQYAAGRYVEAEVTGRQLLAIAERNPGDSVRIAVRSHNLGNIYDYLGRYSESEKLLVRAINLRERLASGNLLDLASCINSLGSVRLNQLAYEDAEKHFQRALHIRETQLGRNHPQVAASFNNLAMVALESGKLQESEQFYRRSLEIKERQNPVDELDVAASKNNLSALYQKQGRPADGERVLRESLAIRQRRLPASQPDIATGLNNLGIALLEQGRYAEAEGLLVRALQLRQQSLPATHVSIASTLNALGIVYSNQGRLVEAENYYRKALRMRQEIFGGDHGEVLASFNNLAILYKDMKRFEESAKLYKRLISLCETNENRLSDVSVYSTNLANMYEARGDFEAAESTARRGLEAARQATDRDPSAIQRGARTLASVLCNAKRYAEAEPLVREVAELSRTTAATPGDQFQIRFLQARVADGLGQRDEALKLLTSGLDLAEQQRVLSAADPEGRAAAFAQLRPALEMLLGWQAESQDFAGLLRTRERARARSLSDQLLKRRLEPLGLLGSQEAARLKTRQDEAQTQLASYEVQLGVIRRRAGKAPSESGRQVAELEEKIASARQQVVQIHREAYALNPAWREVTTENQDLVSIARVQEWLRERKALLLDFYVGERMIAVLMLTGDGPPAWFPLTVDDSAASSLGITAGPLDVVRLDQVLMVGDRQLVQRIAKSDDGPATRKRLAELFPVIFPAAVREALLGGKYEQAFVIPDGPLSLLPLETLIVQEGSSPTYLLDAGPPIAYLPSLTWLFQTASGTASSRVGKHRLLTVGDPKYGLPSASGGATSAGSARFHELGQDLVRLPYTGMESSWVAEGFEKTGATVKKLIGPAATEAAIRSQSPGNTIVHFACHGLVDQLHGNFFGALAVTPGKSLSDPADDGMLTLAEIYALNLSGCELAILSACQTNHGPQQSGEGTWALSRGFLVAGARRTIASNWLVDDEAGASLVSLFSSGLASDSTTGQVNYSRRLQEAKRVIRKQDKWSSPYFWGTFVLVGPN